MSLFTPRLLQPLQLQFHPLLFQAQLGSRNHPSCSSQAVCSSTGSLCLLPLSLFLSTLICLDHHFQAMEWQPPSVSWSHLLSLSVPDSLPQSHSAQSPTNLSISSLLLFQSPHTHKSCILFLSESFKPTSYKLPSRKPAVAFLSCFSTSVVSM